MHRANFLDDILHRVQDVNDMLNALNMARGNADLSRIFSVSSSGSQYDEH